MTSVSVATLSTQWQRLLMLAASRTWQLVQLSIILTDISMRAKTTEYQLGSDGQEVQ